MLPGLFSRVDDLHSGRRPVQDFRVAEVVVNEHFGALDELFDLQRDQSEVAWTGSGEITDSFGWFHDFTSGSVDERAHRRALRDPARDR